MTGGGLTCASRYTISYCWIICLLIWLPWYTMAFISVHVRNSRSQLVMVESGAMMRKGPWIPLRNISERNVMDWMVFPRPISSAKMQFFLQSKKHRYFIINIGKRQRLVINKKILQKRTLTCKVISEVLSAFSRDTTEASFYYHCSHPAYFQKGTIATCEKIREIGPFKYKLKIPKIKIILKQGEKKNASNLSQFLYLTNFMEAKAKTAT